MRRLGIAIATTALLASTVPAAATPSGILISHASVKGAAATFDGWGPDLIIEDTACDDDSVYANWYTPDNGGDIIKLKSSRGCGTSESETLPIPRKVQTTIKYRACVDKSWPTADLCSAWVTDVGYKP
ncbi:hypothetical protein ACIA49_11940 [Kribbella sp. NPDC051587]|uniref:hypothetical protein n=1 Tax=Kribbella sp. NPDC051587 TaxID=3364119 RepID=UPI00378887A2